VTAAAAIPEVFRGVYRDAWIEGPVSEYRYTLSRVWSPGPIVLWNLANPSTANAADEDQTSLKMRGFSRRWGFGGYVATNLGAWRSTDPKQMLAALKTGADVIGPKNDETIKYLAYNLRFVVCAWGDCLGAWGTKRGGEIRSMLLSMGIVPCHLGLTNAGNPRHPLKLAYVTKLEPWT
jgi:hypothetical protein